MRLETYLDAMVYARERRYGIWRDRRERQYNKFRQRIIDNVATMSSEFEEWCDYQSPPNISPNELFEFLNGYDHIPSD